MDIRFFLEQRLSFIKQLYINGTAPFIERIRKIDAEEAPFIRVRSMNPTYHMMGQQVTVASLASSSTAEELRSRPPTMHTAGAQVRGAATYRAPGR